MVTASSAAVKTRLQGWRLETVQPDVHFGTCILRSFIHQSHTYTLLVCSVPGTKLLTTGENSAFREPMFSKWYKQGPRMSPGPAV